MSNRKQTLGLIILSVFLIGSVVGSMFLSPVHDGINDFVPTPDQKELQDITHEPEQTKSVPEGWQLGESVTTISTPKPFFLSSDMNIKFYGTNIGGAGFMELLTADWYFEGYSENTFIDDSNSYLIQADYSAKAYEYLQLDFIIPSFRSGSISYDATVTGWDTSWNTQNVNADREITIGSEHIGEAGIRIRIKALADYQAQWLEIVFKVFDYETNSWDFWADSHSSYTPSNDIRRVRLDFFYFKFTPSTVTEQIRSEYRYSSENVIMHKIDFQVVESIYQIAIYTDWDYSSINPSATVTDMTTYWKITSVLQYNYEMLFTSSSNYFLAIEEKTSNYLTSTEATFEDSSLGGWFDWREYYYGAGYEMDTFEVSTEIVQEGYHSMHIETTADAYPTVSMIIANSDTNLAEGFYLSFWYYWVSTDTFRFGVRNEGNTNWETYTLPTTVTDRWVRYCAYFEGTSRDGYGKSFEFYGADASSTMELYLDSFEIFTVSTEISTISGESDDSISNYEISSVFRVWDGYLNPEYSNGEISMSLIDRTAITITNQNDPIFRETIITNTEGLVNYIYEGTLEQKEYEIRLFAIDSTFNIIEQPFSDLGKWNVFSGGTDYSESFDSESNSIILNFEATATIVYCAFETVNVWSSLDKTTIFYKIKSNNTNGQTTMNYAYETPYTGAYLQNYFYQDFSNSFNSIILHSDLANDNGLLVTQNYVSLRMKFQNMIIGEQYQLSINNLKFLYTDNFYFTPSYAYEQDFGEIEREDSIDFSEGDNENIYSHTYCGNDVIKNGYFQVNKTTTGADYFALHWLLDDLVTNDYTYIYLRVKLVDMDVGSDWGMHLTYYTPSYENQLTWLDITEEWKILGGLVKANKISERLRIDISEVSDNNTAMTGLQIDWIRFNHVEELSYINTDTTVTFESENNLLENIIYSDDNLLGSFTEPSIIGLNNTIDNHNISSISYNRVGESKAFLYDSTNQFTYLVTEADNYFTTINIVVDADGGFFYTIIKTKWGNCTYRVKDNSSWLGAAVNEGSSVWEFDNSLYGLHNFSIVVYNGASEWSSFYTSVTIVQPGAEELSISFYEKSYDSASGKIYINYQTTWENTTVRLADNSTWLGAAVSGEDLSIWSTSTNYGFHNITIIIYHDSNVWFVDTFSFTLAQPEYEGNYFTTLQINTDVDGGYLYVTIYTYFENQTIRVADNSSWLGAAVNEGSSVWEFDNSLYGLHNFSIVVYNGASEWSSFYTSVTIVEPSITNEDLTFHLYSSIDGFGLDQDIVKIYIKDLIHQNWSRVNSDCQIYGDNFSLLIEDYFGNEIYTAENISYARHYDIGIPLMECIFWHNTTLYEDEIVPITVFISTNNISRHFTLASTFQSYSMRLLEGNYTVLCIPDDRYSEDELYQYYPVKESIIVEESAAQTWKTFSVRVQGSQVGEESATKLTAWQFILQYAIPIGLSCTVLGFVINFYFKKRQTKAIEEKSENVILVQKDQSRDDEAKREERNIEEYSMYDENKTRGRE